jgi:hypothetical protein
MNTKLASISLLIVVVAFAFASVIAYANFASAVNSEEGPGLASIDNKGFLLNCILDDATDGVTQRFEPLGCSSINDNMQELSDTNTNDGSENADVFMINHNIPENNNYLNEAHGNYIENPYEVGWD